LERLISKEDFQKIHVKMMEFTESLKREQEEARLSFFKMQKKERKDVDIRQENLVLLASALEKLQEDIFTRQKEARLQFIRNQKTEFQQLRDKKELELFKMKNQNITAEDIWAFKMEKTVDDLHRTRVTDLKWRHLLKMHQLPEDCYQSTWFVLALLFVEEFLSNNVTLGFFRKHDDGAGATDKQDNNDIFAHFQETLPRILLGHCQTEYPTDDDASNKKIFGWTPRSKGIDHIKLEEKLVNNEKLSSRSSEIFQLAGYFIGITILHEICHWKLRNFDLNLDDTPPDTIFHDECGKYMERKLVCGELSCTVKGGDFTIERLFVVPTDENHRVINDHDFRWVQNKNIDKFFRAKFCMSGINSMEDVKLKAKDLDEFKKNNGERLKAQKLAMLFGVDLNSKCGTHREKVSSSNNEELQ